MYSIIIKIKKPNQWQCPTGASWGWQFSVIQGHCEVSKFILKCVTRALNNISEMTPRSSILSKKSYRPTDIVLVIISCWWYVRVSGEPFWGRQRCASCRIWRGTVDTSPPWTSETTLKSQQTRATNTTWPKYYLLE